MVTGVSGKSEAATREQAEGIDQINKAVTQMDKTMRRCAHGEARDA